jgi:hypothetical protein
MRTATRIVLLVAPLLVLPVAALFYTHLNIDRRLFVERLGCGCGPFFNTNHLSLSLCGLLLAGTASSWWFAARSLSRIWFWVVACGFVILGLVFFRQFMYYNAWL